ncbi:hypothetical protein ABZ235_14165 [Streptomyces canus]|uniref:hypothetical protein n=1 Tax=Streptomyces canus TaxID=58343 RepID=UPI0033B99D1A
MRWPSRDFEIEVTCAELPRLSDEELGTLLPEACRGHPSAARRVAGDWYETPLTDVPRWYSARP